MTDKDSRGRYGHFSDDGREYIITDPRTPRPWSNVIANRRVGLAVSQTGSGFSWIDNSQLGTIVRWQQEFSEDRSGRFLYAIDLETGQSWSLAPSPCFPAYTHFACRHGFGETTFETEFEGLVARWTLAVDAEATVELWRLHLEDKSGKPRRLALVAALEWNCGTAPAPRREFQKLFLETRFEAEPRAIFATSHMWDVGSKRWGHWNTPFPYTSAFAAAQPIAAAQGDKAEFLGRNGDWREPRALVETEWRARFGRHYDPIAALRCEVTIPEHGSFDGGFVLATSKDPEEVRDLVRRFAEPAAMVASLANVRSGWRARLASHRISTPDKTFDALHNDWFRYQAISARLWGRAGYYQQSGAFGFRDQLQDSQVWLTIEPERCREQLRLHAGHQFADGSVFHWWHPLTEQGHVTRMTDDLLWLAFVAINYLKETGDFTVLDDRAPFLDEPEPATLWEHAMRAFSRVFARHSERGLPLIGAGDWNDGLSALGLEERGESIWLGHFLAGLLADWAVVASRRGERGIADEFATRRAKLIAAIEEHGWDGGWYARATRDDGTWIGRASNSEGQIFLNAQTWAILNDVASPERAKLAWHAVRERLISEVGALLLAPAYSVPDETVGYITRYAPGLRENGGVYTHAATWAIAAAAKMRDAEAVEALLIAIDPSHKNPERYHAEPYVLPGNVDGPESPLFGRAGWTWYTGSAAWLPRVVSEWVFGVRPTWEGLRFDPCLPPSWNRANLERPWRGATLVISIERTSELAPGVVEVVVDGKPLPSGLLGEVPRGARLAVKVRCG